MRKTNHLQIVTSSLHRTAGPYISAISVQVHRSKNRSFFNKQWTMEFVAYAHDQRFALLFPATAARCGTFCPAAHWTRDRENLPRTKAQAAVAIGLTPRHVRDGLVPAMLMHDPTRRDLSRNKAKNPLAGLRILLAEDEGLIALELERILGDFGCKVVGPLAGVEEVLQNAAADRFDGALLDVNLRGRQIFEIMPDLQKLGLKLIITSGYNDASLFPVAYRALPRIAKPFDENQLRRICEDVFGNPATRRPHRAR